MKKNAVYCLALLIALAVFFSIRWLHVSPKIVLISDAPPAHWIKTDDPYYLGNWGGDQVIEIFRLNFTNTGAAPVHSTLKLHALRAASVGLDHKLIQPVQTNTLDQWKKEKTVDLGNIPPGPHSLDVGVLNHQGPAILMAELLPFGLVTGTNWLVSIDSTNWHGVLLATQPPTLPLSRQFPSAFTALAYERHVVLFIFVLIIFWIRATLAEIPIVIRANQIILSPPLIRALLIICFCVLGANNMFQLPIFLGYDARGHYDYIDYVTQKSALPLAPEGWQMFESPLFYIVAAVLRPLLAAINIGVRDDFHFWVRIIPLACGALQIEVAYRVVRLAFPTRKNLQILGLIFAGVLPMNLYLSQYAGNEPMVALFSAIVILLTLQLLQPDTLITRRALIILGIFLGLALLSKVTPVLLCPVLALYLLRRTTPKNVLLVFATAFVVCGWYYLRNWIYLGKPFVGGWELPWWQEPGYRAWTDLFKFGSSLDHPIYSGVNGALDAFYSTFWLDGYLSSAFSTQIMPHWNYGLMLSGALLALVPTAAILLGLGRPWRSQTTFPCACLVPYILALAYIYFTVPIYSSIKATYYLGLLPCFTLFFVRGIDLLTAKSWAKTLIYPLIAVWAVFAYAAYFVH